MEELEKIKEAEHFLYQMIEKKRDYKVFHFNLSAFLTAARSVIQYANKEITQKNGGQNWYDGEINKYQYITFFKDMRNLNIHQEPVKTKENIIARLDAAKMRLKLHIGAIRIDNDEMAKSTVDDDPEPNLKEKTEEPIIEHEFFFDNWNGPEDVVTLCYWYLEETRSFLRTANAMGYLLFKE